ncbi:uncharacterized protein LOC117504829 isoform X1 [Thalassophryne amazonica]|uniref:uncharacterized protein LOC117504829 isoform X1 n=1 Tax=Thalassophryne amazonica TaxID=390379 RepID=UPI0014719357|nr:uncharacterized protein LOC117504829 isoform X1 [Thalassophryne amazonica]
MQHQFVSKEDGPPEQQEWKLSLNQKDLEPPNIKEEQEELWIKAEEKPHSSQLHQSQRGESTQVERLPSDSCEHKTLKMEDNGEDVGGSKPASNSGPWRYLQPDSDDIQKLSLIKEETLPEQQQWNLIVDQDNIKEEQEKLWISQQGEHLHQLEEADVTKFPFTAVCVKTENDDDEKPESSQLHQSQSGESTEAEPVASSSTVPTTLTGEAEGDDCGGSQPDSGSSPCSHLQSDTDDVQQVLVNEDVLPEEQEWNQSRDQMCSERPNIKEEQKELCSSQEAKPLHSVGEAGASKFPVIVVFMKCEGDEKQQLQLHQSQSDESIKMEHLTSNSSEHGTLKGEADGDNCGGSQPATSSEPCSQLPPDNDGVDSTDQPAHREEGPFETSLCGDQETQTRTWRKCQLKMKQQRPNTSVPYVKRPLNAFMVFMREKRKHVMEKYGVRDCAILNNILGDLWKNLTEEEQAKYYNLAEEEKILHSKLYPNWSASDNYGRKKKRVKPATSNYVQEKPFQDTQPGVVLESENRPQTETSICNTEEDRPGGVQSDIKKPPNAYILFNREKRPLISSMYNVTDSSTVSQIISKQWKSLSMQEKSKYLRMAEKERRLHYQLYPNWSPKENYGKKSKKGKPRTSKSMDGAAQIPQAPCWPMAPVMVIENQGLDQSAPAGNSRLQTKYIKKPANAFMIFVREERERATSRYNVTESARLNQLLGKQWKTMTKEEKAKYFEMAQEEKKRHSQLNPNWSFRDNYAKKAKLTKTHPST